MWLSVCCDVVVKLFPNDSSSLKHAFSKLDVKKEKERVSKSVNSIECFTIEALNCSQYERLEMKFTLTIRFYSISLSDLLPSSHPSLLFYSVLLSTVELKFNLDQYVNKRYPGLVKIVRNSKREGLIRARIHGWNAATAPVVGFFDAHVEFNAVW